jgi:hypothetical protein
MIRPLRRRHFIFSVLMLAGLPFLVIHGYLKSHKETTMPELPKLDTRHHKSFPLEVWHKPRLWKNFPELNTRLLSDTSAEHTLAIELTYEGTISHSDILIYWSPRSFSVKTGIGETMHLVGAFTTNETTVYQLPDIARKRDGFLILYSMAEDQVVSEAPIVNPLK